MRDSVMNRLILLSNIVGGVRTSSAKGRRHDVTGTGLAGYGHSAIMRKNPNAIERAHSYLEFHRQFTFSVITRYEILRGLIAKGAAKQMDAFEQLCAASRVLPLTDPMIVQAASVYADLHRRGELIGDADILIAANGYALVSGRSFKTGSAIDMN